MASPVPKKYRLVLVLLAVGVTATLAAFLWLKPVPVPPTTGLTASVLPGPDEPPPPAGELPRSKLSPELQQLWQEKNAAQEPLGDAGPHLPGSTGTPPAGEAKVEVTITAAGTMAKEKLIKEIEKSGGSILRGRDEPGTALRARVAAPLLEELARREEIIFIERYQPPTLLNDRAAGIVAAASVTIPGLITPDGLTGQGQVVGLADSGLDAGSAGDIHPDLASTPGEKPKVIMLKSWAGRTVADDPHGHGTHMAATIAGTGAVSSGQFRGLAPEASLYFQGLLNAAGEIDPPADLTALFTPAYAADVHIHVDGWGSPANAYLAASFQADAFVREHPDFLVVFGAGNSGPDSRSLTTEANSKNALVVGASQSSRPTFSPEAADPAQVASFSSRGPANDGRLKPEVVAPGTAIISAASRLIENNFPPNPDYTWMQGTSMAAGVAGGMAALVREYLQASLIGGQPGTDGGNRPLDGSTSQETSVSPTAALLKAILINGAQFLPGVSRQAQGFGRLDATGTLLALQEKAFALDDNTTGLATGDSRQYTYRVTAADTPLKVTLAWTDPPARPGAGKTLVNDLDLAVTGPDGRRYLGNDWEAAGQADRVNNVEQVYISHPLPGTYTIIIRGAEITTAATHGAGQPRQDYALVYGQPLLQDIVIHAAGQTIETLDGSTLNLEGKKVKYILDGATESDKKVRPGTQIYASPRSIYLVGQSWKATAVRTVRLGNQWAVVEANPHLREGGYYLSPEAEILLNKEPAVTAHIPPGVDIDASLNPVTQSLWAVETTGQEKQGILARLNQETGELKLLGEQQVYQVPPGTTISFADQLIDVSPADQPFGRGAADGLDELLPGMPVRMTISPDSDTVNYLAVRRPLAIGTIAAVDVARGSLTLDTGHTYPVLPGAPVTRNGQEASLADLAAGDHLTAVVLPDTQEIAMVNARERVYYGQVIYLDEKNNRILLKGELGPTRTLPLAPDVRVQRWGLEADPDSVPPESWVRLTPDVAADHIRHIDVAETEKPLTSTITGCDPEQGRLVTEDGATYHLAPYTVITKNGHPSRAESLVPGEKITLTPLVNPDGGPPVVATAAATTRPGVTAPVLRLAIHTVPQETVLAGTTTADLLYLVLPENNQSRPLAIKPDGSFAASFPIREQEVQLIAIDTRRGGVNYQRIMLPPAPSPAILGDITGHWAAREIGELAKRGIVGGYPDGSFRPEKPVSRVELVAMLTRALGWAHLPAPPAGPDFTDAAVIPDWARGSMAIATERGLVAGYADGSFRPQERVTREEAAAFVDRALHFSGYWPPEGNEVPPGPSLEELYDDYPSISPWARKAVTDVRTTGILVGRGPREFAPRQPLTRAEAAVVIYRLP